MAVTARFYDRGISYADVKIATRYVGATIKLFSKEERIMSDVWAMVQYAVSWDAENGCAVETAVGNSEFGQNTDTSYVIDATDEVIATYEAWVKSEEERVDREREEAERARVAHVRKVELETPTRGKVVRVARGRKVPVGTVGEIVWYGKGKSYGYGPAEFRVGIKEDDGTVHWTAAKNVDVILQSVGECNQEAA